MAKRKCCVCSALFDVIEVHHVIPQSCGGRDGATVELCGAHHSLIHFTADKFCRDYKAGQRSMNPETYKWTGDDRPHWSNGWPLIQAIVKAQLDPDRNLNSVHSMRVVMTPAEREVIKRLQTVLGLSSQEKVIRTALAELAHKHGVRAPPRQKPIGPRSRRPQ